MIDSICATLKSDILTVIVNVKNIKNCEFAYYLMKDGKRINTIWYSDENSKTFELKGIGNYHVTCFVKQGETLARKDSALIIFPENDAQHGIPETSDLRAIKYNIDSKLNGNEIICKISPQDYGFANLEFAFYLMKGLEKIDEIWYSSSNICSFILSEAGVYAVTCFVRRGKKLVVRTSSYHGYKQEVDWKKKHVSSIDLPRYEPLRYPYIDFAFIASDRQIEENARKDIEQYTNLKLLNKHSLGKYQTYLVTDDSIAKESTILSGILNENDKFCCGQRNVDYVDQLDQEGVDLTTMSGTFTLLRYIDNKVQFSFDFFGANHLFYYWDGSTAIVANRLILILYVLRALKVSTEINYAYISASMTFNDGLISSSNFLSELAIKNLFFLPLNKYIEFDSDGIHIRNRNIQYGQIPYNDDHYKELLYKAREDILQKLKNIEMSEVITNYRISLSGGFDSRLNIAALSNNKTILNKTTAQTNDTYAANDLEISLYITNHYGIKYFRYEDFFESYNIISFEKRINQYRNDNLGMYHILLSSSIIEYHSSKLLNTIQFVGSFGETMRSRNYLSCKEYLHTDDSEKEIVYKLMNKLDCRITGCNDSGFFNSYLNEIVNTPGSSSLEKFDNMHTFYYMRYHFSRLINRSSADGHSYSLFMSHYLYEASRMLSLQQRANNKVMLDMCYILNPELLAIPFSSYGRSDADVTIDKSGELIFDSEKVPSITLNGDRDAYDNVLKDNIENVPLKLRELNVPYTEELYKLTIDLYCFFRTNPQTENYFDDHLYWYIQCYKDKYNVLFRIYSKMSGIYDQLTISGTVHIT